MYYIIDNTTGEVLAEVAHIENVDPVLDDLTAMFPYEMLEIASPNVDGNIPATQWADWVA